jgi:hypothetical protein
VRVVHVAPTLFGPGGLLGGGERYPVELARALAARGHELERVVLSTRGGGRTKYARLAVRALTAARRRAGVPGAFPDFPAPDRR